MGMTAQTWLAPLTAVAVSLACGGVACSQSPAPVQPATPASDAAKPVTLVVEDQFARRQDLAAHRGDVVVLVYGDRVATDACKELGQKLHVLFHPTAAGKPPAEAHKVPVVALEGVPAGKRSPDALILPVALVGNVPALVRDLVRGQIKKASPDVPVWLDFTGTMEKQFGLRAGEPNFVVFDAEGRLRLRVNGTPDQPTTDKLLQAVQNLRAEAAGIAK
jgi:cytochrome oxidase Cu insertion factor (SCO1/SenC/PrrC family)